jgi:hypothetical protein
MSDTKPDPPSPAPPTELSSIFGSIIDKEQFAANVSSALSGAASGALIGSAISPVVGTFIGAAAGALLGATVMRVKAVADKPVTRAKTDSRPLRRGGRIRRESGVDK